MVVTHKLRMDLEGRNLNQWVEAVQGDAYTRRITMMLFSKLQQWPVPEGATVLIRFKKPDGKCGEYDTLPDGTAAWSVSGNELTVVLAPQVLTAAGSVMLSASIILNEKIINTFGVGICVRTPVGDWDRTHPQRLEESRNYFCVTGIMPAPEQARAGQFIRVLDVDDNGKVTRVEGVDEAAVHEILERYWAENEPEDGKPGGYYVPEVRTPEKGSMQLYFTGSKADMPAVTSGVIEIPEGPQGEKGEKGEKGDKGDPGSNTPVKGVDYWTEAEREAMITEVMTALGTPVFGTVDTQNNIILTGNLEEGTYTLKYEDAAGGVTVIGTVDIGTASVFNVPLSWSYGTKLSKTTGEVESTEDDQFNASDYISLESGVSYTVATSNDCYNAMHVLYYDDSNAFVAYQESLWTWRECEIADGQPASGVLQIPTGATKIRLRHYETANDHGWSVGLITLTGTRV